MRRHLPVVLAAISTAVLGWTSQGAMAAPLPDQDTVEVRGSTAVVENFSYQDIEISVSSGPSGENPTGSVSFTANTGGTLFFFRGQITCLSVSGNTASMELITQPGALFANMGIYVVDNGTDGSDIFGAAPTLPESDCSFGTIPGFSQVLSSGDAVVHDAAAVPTSKADCKADGWQHFGFKNAGQCVAFVQRGPKP
jgi:hypothetical protein